MLLRSLLILLLSLSFLCSKGQDYWPPDTPELDSVSVYDNINGYTIVTWFPCDSADVVAYIIYRNVNTIWETIDTVPAPATSYIDMTALSHQHAEMYRIAAFDEAGNLSMMTPVEGYHNSIYVFPYQETENCQPHVRLHWNRYLNWPEGIKEYQIWVSVNSSPYTLHTTLNYDANEYKHFGISDTTLYCYYIKAISNSGKTSTSNLNCRYIDYDNIPAYVNIDYVTVNGSGGITIACTADNSAQIRNLRLEREKTGTGNFIAVASVSNFNQSTWMYNDNTDISTEWTYRLCAVDDCGNTLITSNTATNIVVRGYRDRELNHYLNWNHYRYFTGDVDHYELYRKNDDGPSELIATLSDTSYIDNVAGYADGFSYGKFNYFVVARESLTFPGKGYSSTSSTADIYEFARVFIPNSFSPNSDTLNAIFKPSASFVVKDSYYFAIYSRWGDKLFETKSVNEGWDGKHKGKPVKQDSYVYILKYSSHDGETKEKSGFVHVYYPLSN